MCRAGRPLPHKACTIKSLAVHQGFPSLLHTTSTHPLSSVTSAYLLSCSYAAYPAPGAGRRAASVSARDQEARILRQESEDHVDRGPALELVYLFRSLFLLYNAMSWRESSEEDGASASSTCVLMATSLELCREPGLQRV